MNLNITRTMTVATVEKGQTVAKTFEAGKSYEVDEATRKRLARAGALGDASAATASTPDNELPEGGEGEAFDFEGATKAELIEYAKRHKIEINERDKVDEVRAAVKAKAKAE